MSIRDLVNECESLIRTGQIGAVQKIVLGLPTSKIDRHSRLQIANLCRRTGLVNHGLKVLSPLIEIDRGGWRTIATPGELAEHAILLQRAGATQEALWVLDQVDATACPDAHLFRAFCRIGIWEYAAAAESLLAFLRAPITDYQRLVAQVNLAAARLALGMREEAGKLLEEVLPPAREGGFTRLTGNCHELRAQLNFQLGRFDEARMDLRSAAGQPENGRSLDHFLTRKWMAIVSALESRRPEPMLELRKEALERGDSESVREADRFLLRVEFDENRFRELLFGTPFALYRQMILAEHEGRRLETSDYLWGDSNLVFNLHTGELDSGSVATPTQGVHRILSALSKDFYRPLAIGGLFAEIFPGEHFNVLSSPQRVHQAIYRARQWAATNEIPLVIEEVSSCFRLVVKPGFGLLVPYEREFARSEDMRLVRLRSRFTREEFRTPEAQECLDLSVTSVKNLLAEAVASGQLVRTGKGKATAYRFAA